MSEAKPVVRCAIYTRKSAEEGLEQDFNTLQAQREAAEAYILSQKQSGWHSLPDAYDDGGFSGATLDRPALARLLQAVEARELDCVVVYKVDRLSRSLLDFARLLSLFEKHGVSFVSVTQDFNTTTSLGRLTLNILLSFAQFGREIISERTRDKLSAARRKGKWTGGNPVLGYDVDARGGRLVVNEVEAERVREIFSVCARTTTIAEAVRQVNARGLMTKDWISKAGAHHRARKFQNSTLDFLIRNVIYKGQICHKGVVYPGEHQPIISSELWDRVNQQHKPGARKGKPHTRVQTLLAGFLYCSGCGLSLAVTYTSRHGTRQAYYVCSRCKGHTETGKRIRPLPTAVLESSLVRELEPILGDQPGEIAIQHCLERVTYDPVTRQVSVSLRDGSRFMYSLPAQPERQSKPGRVPAVSRAMALAIAYQELARERKLSSYEELAKLGRLTRSRLSQILLLTNLAPAIQEELLFLPKLLSGPARLTESQLRNLAKRVDWGEQMEAFRSLWDASSAGSSQAACACAPLQFRGRGYSSMPSNGTPVPRFCGTTALSGPACAECAR
ncbi:MAG: recombinase family protein [Bryobacteraceae bacterium]